MVRRLFSLTNIFDNWKTELDRGDSKKRTELKPRAASLNDVTLYTSLESCAQCGRCAHTIKRIMDERTTSGVHASASMH